MTKQLEISKFKEVRLLDLAILLYNVHRAAEEAEVGFYHASESLDSLTKLLDKKAIVRIEDIEAALWSSNLLDEQGKFWHPQLKFKDWVRNLVGKYNQFYCIVEEESRK